METILRERYVINEQNGIIFIVYVIYIEFLKTYQAASVNIYPPIRRPDSTK